MSGANASDSFPEGALSLVEGSRLRGLARLGGTSAELSLVAALIPAADDSGAAAAAAAPSYARLELRLTCVDTAILAAAHESMCWRLRRMSMPQVTSLTYG